MRMPVNQLALSSHYGVQQVLECARTLGLTGRLDD
jgi:hypothetical protein